MNKFIDSAAALDVLSPVGRKYPEREDPAWRPFYENIDKKYKDKRALPKGTIVYHGSLSKSFTSHPRRSEEPVMFFGLDFPISAWILPEAVDNKYKQDNKCMQRYGYVHVFKLKKAMSYEYIMEDMCTTTDAPNTERCSKAPCVHAQVWFQGPPHIGNNFNGLGTELSMPFTMIDGHLQHIGVHTLDIMQLAMYACTNSSWNPKAAVRVDKCQ